MKRILFLILMTMNLFFTAYTANAQAPDKVIKTDPADANLKADEIVTAIDVAELWNKGLGDADIASRLSTQRGFDRQAALNKGVTDEKIIDDLITNPGNAPTM